MAIKPLVAALPASLPASAWEVSGRQSAPSPAQSETSTAVQDTQPVADQNQVQANPGAQWSPVSDTLAAANQDNLVQMPDKAPRISSLEQARRSLESFLLVNGGIKLSPEQIQRFEQVYARLSPQAQKGLLALGRLPTSDANKAALAKLAEALNSELARVNYKPQHQSAVYEVSQEIKKGDTVTTPPPPEKVPGKKQVKEQKETSPSEKQSLLRGYLNALLAPYGVPPGSPGKSDIVNALPNLEHNKRVKLEINHPEKPMHLDGTRSLFKTSQLQSETPLGWGFDIYGYCDTSWLTKPATSAKPATAGKQAQPAQAAYDVYYGQMIRNDSAKAMTIQIEGSAFTSHPDDLPPGTEERVPGTKGEKRVRGADISQAESMQTGRNRRMQTITIPPGGAVLLWTRTCDERPESELKTSQNRAENVRTQFHIDIIDPKPGSEGEEAPKLSVEVFLTDKPKEFGIDASVPASVRDPKAVDPSRFHGLVEIPPGSTALAKAEQAPLFTAAEVEADHNVKGHPPFKYLPRGVDIEVLQTAYGEIYDKVIASDKVSVAPGENTIQARLEPLKSPATKEVDDAKKHLASLLAKPRPEPGTEAETKAEAELEKAHDRLALAEHKVFVIDHFQALYDQDTASISDAPQGELSQAERSRYQSVIRSKVPIAWPDLFPLRRMSGAMSGNQATGVIPRIDMKEPGSLTYVLNSKVSSGGGTTQDQSTQVLAPLMFEGRPANLSKVAHGNYGISYSVVGSVENTGQVTRSLQILFGKANENKMVDNNDAKPVYDRPVSDKEPMQTNAAFTGLVRVLVPGHEPIEVDVIQGMVQQPQELLNQVLKVEPGETLSYNIEFMVPNNSTGPQTVQLAWK